MSKIKVQTESETVTLNVPDGKLLSKVLAENGFTVPAACAGRGTCRKCAVKLVNGSFKNEDPDPNGMIRSCKAIVNGDAEITADFAQGDGLTELSQKIINTHSICGAAVDIGTTTLAATLKKSDGSLLSASCLNPQSAYGADVVSRINACKNGALKEQTELIRTAVKKLIDSLATDEKPEELIVSGNATMLHIFCGISPESMGCYPFTPQFTDAKILSGTELGFDIEKIVILPSVSAFVGADIVSGIFALNMHKTDKKIFLADLGTNGELVLTVNGRMYCTSTAAGPALEGACIECGTGGIKGAIDSVYKSDSEISFTTIGGIEPAGICGSGLTDAISIMLDDGIVDDSGYMDNGDFYLCDNVYISQSDIRQFQLAKSAIYSGIETMSDTAEISISDIDTFYIAGGLGYYISTDSAFKAGLLPEMPKHKVVAAGNTSLNGAVMCIGNKQAISEMQIISENCQPIDLGGNPQFNQRFIDNMFFGGE